MDRGLLLVTVPIACLVLGITYRFFLDPLAKYPGPAIAKLTGFYTMYLAVTGQKTYATYDMHRKYGKVVRIGPNELCFFDLDSIKDIYGQSTQLCTKATAFYGGFTMTGADSVFSTRDRAVHGRMRRLLSYGFSQQGVLQFEQDIRQMVGHYQGIVGSSPQPVDFYALTQHLFLDITSHLSFAKSFDTLTQGSNPGAEDIFTYFNICPLFGEVPIARYLPFGIFRAAKQAQPRIISWAQSRIDEVRAEVRAGTAGHGLLRSMIEAEDSETGQAFSDEELIENAVIFVLAGSATSATTVLYLLWAVAKHPAVEKRLLREVREAFPDPEVLPEYKDASNLPYLNCVLQEALRLWGPANTVAPRVSPGKMIGGVYVPAGVVVSNPPYTTHRDPAVFPEPNQFIPERWESATAEMKAMYRPFHIGPRNCVGMHLARVQMLLTICALYRKFDLTLDPQMTDEMMYMRDQGLMDASGKKLLMHAVPRQI